jgi:peptide/nickel transport system substrate-binding protein
MEEVVALDERTLAIRWRRPYPRADSFTGDSNFPPLPRHILERALQPGQADSFVSLPFWTREYVGLGPYRLDRWEPGSLLEGVAFDGHVLGRARIDRVQMRIMPDQNTVLANLLSEEVHMALDNVIAFQQAATLQGEWGRRNAGVVLLSPQDLRYSHVQLRPELAMPRAMLDARVRQALLHAFDREAISQGLLDGQGVVAHTIVPPQVGFFPAVDGAVTKYPYDLRRTEQLMGQAGWSRGSDGIYTSASGERFQLEVWTTAGSQFEQEMGIMLSVFRTAGFETGGFVIPVARMQDGELRARFPALQNNTSRRYEGTLRTLTASAIPGPENRWTGNNRGGFSHPEFERMREGFESALDPSERGQLIVRIAQLLSDELPIFPIHYNFNIAAHLVALHGPGVVSPDSTITWSIHAWTLE